MELLDIDEFTGTKEDAGLAAIFLSAYSIYLDKQSDEYWGSAQNIYLHNASTILTSHYLGFDVTEDDEWLAFCLKASPREIDFYTIQRIKQAFDAQNPEMRIFKKKPLMIVSLEGAATDENVIADVINNPKAFCLYTSANLKLSAGWTAEQIQKLHAMDIGDAYLRYGALKHTIIRLQ